MKAPSINMEKPAAGLMRHILSKNGVECSILALAPGEQTTCVDPLPIREHIFVVIEGGVTVRMGEVTYLVQKDDAMHIPVGQEPIITADSSNWAKLVRIDLAPRPIPGPLIYGFPEG